MGYKAGGESPCARYTAILTENLLWEDADATLTSPMLLGVCDGVSQLEETMFACV